MRKPVWIVGLDVGGTKTAGGLVRFPDGERRDARVIPTDATRGGPAVLADVRQLARDLAVLAAESGEAVAAIGLGICELVDRTGRLASANCVDWLNLPVATELAAIAPTVLEADVRAAALAEAWLGAGRPFRNFLYLTVGTGISCCLVLEGEPYLGARGLTGTMASSPLSVPCEHCGRTGGQTLEELAAGPGLVARFRAAGGQAANGREVIAAASAGDSVARGIVESGVEALAAHLGLLVNTLDPEAVVIGGGLGLSEGPYHTQLLTSTRRHIWSNLHRELPILRAETGRDAGWIGAAARAARHLGHLPKPQDQP